MGNVINSNILWFQCIDTLHFWTHFCPHFTSPPQCLSRYESQWIQSVGSGQRTQMLLVRDTIWRPPISRKTPKTTSYQEMQRMLAFLSHEIRARRSRSQCTRSLRSRHRHSNTKSPFYRWWDISTFWRSFQISLVSLQISSATKSAVQIPNATDHENGGGHVSGRKWECDKTAKRTGYKLSIIFEAETK